VATAADRLDKARAIADAIKGLPREKLFIQSMSNYFNVICNISKIFFEPAEPFEFVLKFFRIGRRSLRNVRVHDYAILPRDRNEPRSLIFSLAVKPAGGLTWIFTRQDCHSVI